MEDNPLGTFSNPDDSAKGAERSSSVNAFFSHVLVNVGFDFKARKILAENVEVWVGVWAVVVVAVVVIVGASSTVLV